ncbi:MAG TPA: ATP-binding protein, partial [bacterium]|nr:ATP-binding protein [bacterium]
IVRHLLDFSREKSDEKMEPVFLGDVVSKTMSLVSVSAKQVGVQVVQDLDPDLPTITGDFNRLQQVVLNLVTNSVFAMKDKGGTLSLCTFSNPERCKVFLQIADTGVGIAPKDLDRIFDPYFTTKEPGEGTGLGLSICYKIIEAHKGKIDVESDVGLGTTITIAFVANPATRG